MVRNAVDQRARLVAGGAEGDVRDLCTPPCRRTAQHLVDNPDQHLLSLLGLTQYGCVRRS